MKKIYFRLVFSFHLNSTENGQALSDILDCRAFHIYDFMPAKAYKKATGGAGCALAREDQQAQPDSLR